MVRPLPPGLQKVAIEELHEDPARVQDDIDALKTWIQQQPHLRARTDDQFLVAFLRGCKYSLEKAKSKIDKYYMLRSKFPELFSLRDVDEPKIQEIIKLGIGIALPTPLNEDGPRIMLVRNGCYDPEKYNFADIMRVFQAWNEILMWEDDYAIVNGFMVVYGSNLDKFYEKIPQKYLPKEYGGENGSIPEIIAEWEQKFQAYKEYFKEDAKYGTDEHLRPGKPIDFDNLFGMEGSFRKLNVD
ncbi:alpha-tocopherol transfer protein-like [Musca vetustissima]|uniref:alpha-tocopherol transfer protein-like n=1 Tax=Musca vetustissima TaxID=27455 RepID=UPI002AB6D87A|nr:alpha-tocopherol transfer protein-like [Musca vetustissima]